MRRTAEMIWHIFSLVLLTGAFIPLWRQQVLGDINLSEGDPVQRLTLGIAYLGIIFMILQPRRTISVAIRGRLLWILLSWVLLSALWSIAPLITLRRGLAACLGALYGLLLVVRYPPKTTLRILGTTLGIVVIASLVAVVVYPMWGVMVGKDAGAWQGVMTHKNILGRTTVLATIVFFVLLREAGRIQRLILALLLMLAVGVLIGSRSFTSLLALLLAFGAWWSMHFMARIHKILRVACVSFGMAIALPTGFLISAYLEDAASLFGKSLTLTGRIPLWNALIPYILERPLLGFGYGAFWFGQEGPYLGIWNLLPWEPTHAHNGYLDLWLEVGFVGMVLGTALVLFVLFRTGRFLLKEKRNHANQPLYNAGFLFSVSFLFLNGAYALLMESRLGTAIYWVFLVVVYFYLISEDMSPQKGLNEVT